jgi:hypothetical protein
VVSFSVPGAGFDLASFNFQVPIFGSSAAKHAAPAKKQSATVNPIVLIFMPPSSTDFQLSSMFLFKLTNQRDNPQYYAVATDLCFLAMLIGFTIMFSSKVG